MLIGEKVFDDIEKKDLAQTLKYLHRKYIQYINWAKREGTDRAKKLLQKLNEIALTDEDIVTMNTEKNDMNLAYMSVANIKGFEI
jgi:hypothetical protein